MGKSSHGPGSIRTVALLGNHLPRHCGIATFTTDLAEALATEGPEVDCIVVAMNDPGAHHVYPPRVRFEIAEGDVLAYRRAADFLNVNAVDVVSVQHEYGIFGARAGANVLELLRELRMPIVSTLHTVVASPTPEQRGVLDALIALSARLVVMSADSAALLCEVHGVDRAKIDVIPHGIPRLPERAGKDRLGLEGRAVVLTFGLLSPDKGIEHVIDAMPEIVRRHPSAVYVVLGATHPHIKQRHGEAYRQMLETRAARLGVQDHVVFHDRFVSHDELVEFLGAADVYITPYLNEGQSTSGTLAYAVGCGKAVISTPYRYARELLGDGRGILVPWRDSGAIAGAIVDLLDHPDKRRELQTRAAAFGTSMSWPLVARQYMKSFEEALSSHEERRRTAFAPRNLVKRTPALPEIDLSHVRVLTDDTGILQHATYTIPRRHDGYCTDDNARALLLVTLVEEEGTEAPQVVRGLSSRYLAFVSHALDPRSGRFRNFMSYDRAFRDEAGSDDCHGRALWALGTVVGRSADPGAKAHATDLFRTALRGTSELTSPRAWAYALLGIDEYLRAHREDRGAADAGATLALRLLERWEHSSSPEWPWFEDRLTYCNARLPQALLVTSAWKADPRMREVGERALDWLVTLDTAPNGTYSPVGTDGFHVRGRPRAHFDQQPVEACSMVSACLDAYRVTGSAHWANAGRRAFEWFLGRNALHAPVFDAATGGCRDGLHADRMNENQGAESTLSFLISVAQMRAAARIAAKLVAGPAGTANVHSGAIAAGAS